MKNIMINLYLFYSHDDNNSQPSTLLGSCAGKILRGIKKKTKVIDNGKKCDINKSIKKKKNEKRYFRVFSEDTGGFENKTNQ